MGVRGALVLTLAVALGSTGCTVSNGSAPPPTTTPAQTPVAKPTGLSGEATISVGGPQEYKPATKITLDGREVMALPGLEFPEGAKVGRTFTELDEQTIVLSAPPSAKVLEHFEYQLPRTGYAVALSDGVTDRFTFSGSGWDGKVVATTAAETHLTFWKTRAAPVDSQDLKLTNVPFFLKFPGGTKAASISDQSTGTSLRFAAPAPAEVLRYYRDAADGPLWTIIKDAKAGDTTTLVFTDSDGWTVTVVTTPTTATLTTRAP